MVLGPCLHAKCTFERRLLVIVGVSGLASPLGGEGIETLNGITSINSGHVWTAQAGPTGSTQPRGSFPTVAGPAHTGTTGGVGSAGRSSSIVSEVGQMLRDIGGGIENNQSLQTLIALIIFMALLQAAQQGTAQGSQNAFGLLEQLAQSGSGQGGSAAILIEQTTISYSSTTIISSYASDGLAHSTSGGLLDFQA